MSIMQTGKPTLTARAASWIFPRAARPRVRGACEMATSYRPAYHRPPHRLVMVCSVMATLLYGVTSPVRAQDTTSKHGFNPGASYAISDIESVGTANGNLGLHIPIASLPSGRGGGAGISLIYNSKLWDTPVSIVPTGDVDSHGVPVGVPQNYLKASREGGWRYGAGYEVRLRNRLDDYAYSYFVPSCEQQYGTQDHSADQIYKVEVIFPDGSSHEFAPQGFQYAGYTTGDGYYSIRPDGYRTYCQCVPLIQYPYVSCTKPLEPYYNNTMTYYSTDGTYLRLDVLHDSDGSPWSNSWVMYAPDGTRVVGAGLTGIGGGAPEPGVGLQRIYDRNNNYVEVQNNRSAVTVTDQFNRTVWVERDPAAGVDYIHAAGFNNAPLTWTVHWKTVYVKKTYRSSDPNGSCPTRLYPCMVDLRWNFQVIDRIELPAQAGGLAYDFGYNGLAQQPDEATPPSVGWGELNSVTLPSGASAGYAYKRDSQSGIYWDEVLQNHPLSKTLSYLREYDGSSSQSAETWTYALSFARKSSTSQFTEVTAPDGGKTSDTIKYSYTFPTPFDSGLSYRTESPDGKVVERLWAHNTPAGHYLAQVNPYVKTEFTSIRDTAGNLSKTVIKDYSYDKNGNVTQVREYDWVDYGAIHTGPGQSLAIPGDATLERVTTNKYYSPTPDAADITTADADCYQNATSPRLRSALASTEVADGAQTFSRSEYTYDDAATTGNLTELQSWDSTKGALLAPQPGGSRLDPANSISARFEYDENTADPALRYGNLTLAVDANGNRTKYTYGTVTGPNGAIFTGLYPTAVVTAEGTSVQRTSSSVYDFSTGLVVKTNDEDNQVSTSAIYDALGRPTLVKAADGVRDANNILIERHTVAEYLDSLRLVVMRADLKTTGDGKLVSVQHYDQLGRLRLSRTLEDPSQDADDERVGIKVQTRYMYSGQNSYTLVSNPYRASYSYEAGGEETMGWTLKTADRIGRTVRSETFGGKNLPAPFAVSNPNALPTGSVATAYSVNTITVTDQINKQRRFELDALGRIARAFEASHATDYNYQTTYAYDVNDNLTQVVQGVQTRTFNYNSLSRLTSTHNPENGTVQYWYDGNGNMVLKIDPRPRPGQTQLSPCPVTYAGDRIATCYEYDSLGRLKSRSYNDGTPNVSYTYDASGAYSKGQLSAVSSSISTYKYLSYDAFGRVRSSEQIVDGLTYSMLAYDYDLAGNLISEQYPSGRVVKTEYDASGRVVGVSNQAKDFYYVGAKATDPDRIQYAPHGAVSALKLGNGLWEHTVFNNRLQPTRMGVGALVDAPSLLRLDYTYGKEVDGTPDPSKNNGNVWSQEITAPGLESPLRQAYTYDEVDRLTLVKETKVTNGEETWKQGYTYMDRGGGNARFGNRRVDAANTSQGLVPLYNPHISPSTNRIDDPGYVYDDAGNLICEQAHPCLQSPFAPSFT